MKGLRLFSSIDTTSNPPVYIPLHSLHLVVTEVVNMFTKHCLAIDHVSRELIIYILWFVVVLTRIVQKNPLWLHWTFRKDNLGSLYSSYHPHAGSLLATTCIEHRLIKQLHISLSAHFWKAGRFFSTPFFLYYIQQHSMKTIFHWLLSMPALLFSCFPCLSTDLVRV